MSDNAIFTELIKRSEFKARNYQALYHKAKAQGDTLRASLYASLASNAENDTREYRAMLNPYTREFASA